MEYQIKGEGDDISLDIWDQIRTILEENCITEITTNEQICGVLINMYGFEGSSDTDGSNFIGKLNRIKIFIDNDMGFSDNRILFNDVEITIYSDKNGILEI